MKNYYYARKSKTVVDSRTGKEEIFLEVPIIVAPETEEVNGKHVSLVKIGGWHMPCYFDWIPASYYHEHKKDIEAVSKAEERKHRCLIDDGKGGRIMCPECNSCIGCPRAAKFDFDNGHDASYEALQENGFDAETGEEVESDFDAPSTCFANPEDEIIRNENEAEHEDYQKNLSFVFDVVTERLNAKKPKYAAIFTELRKGVDKPSDIARNAGLRANRTCEDVPKVMKMAAPMVRDVMIEFNIKL